MNLLSYITLVFTANTSRFQVTFALSAVQGLCVTTVDRNLYPLCVSARQDSTPIWIPPGSQQGVQNEQGVLLPKQCVRGGGVVCLVRPSANISRPRDVSHSPRGSTSSICRTDQVVTGHLLFITKSLFTEEDLATNIVAQALTHDGSEEF